MAKPKIVLKFGGTSVASVNCIRDAAKIVQNFSKDFQVVVVVSAMAKFTNSLVEYTSYFYDVNNNKERDTVLSSGEQITVGLFALALEELSLKAKSLLAWQVPIVTNNIYSNAQIKEIPYTTLNSLLEKNIIPVVAGFQGITNNKNVTTLGRGGSDTTAVAIAVAIKAKSCYIYTDVEGICVCDPNIVPNVKVINKLSFPQVIEMANSGAKVLHCRSAELAFKNNIPLWIKSTFTNAKGTIITNNGDESVEGPLITAIVTSTNEVLFNIRNIDNVNHTHLKILDKILKAGIAIDMLNTNHINNKTELKFSVSKDNFDNTIKILKQNQDLVQEKDILYNKEVAKLSVIGVGLQTSTSIMQNIFSNFVSNNATILLTNLANLKISFIVLEADLNSITNSLHKTLSKYIKTEKNNNDND